MCNACGNFIVVTKQEILVIYLTDFFDAASWRHNDIILLPAIRRVSVNDFMFQQDSAPHTATRTWQQLNCCVNRRQTFLRQICGLEQPRSEFCGLRYLGCHAESCRRQTNP